MEQVQANLPYKAFPTSDGVVERAYCTQSGLLAGANCPSRATGYYRADDLPDTCNYSHSSGVTAVKLYPAGATTHSDQAVTSLPALAPVLEALSELGMPLLVHGEVTDSDVDIFDREKVFIDRYLRLMLLQFPRLKLVLEHITTSDAADFVTEGGANLAATITPQHLLMNRNHLLVGGIRPHNYCLPVLKRRQHQEALQKAVASGNRKFFLGTDSAPHAQGAKEMACGCAGCYTALHAMEMYAEAFERAGAIDKLEAFASFHGPAFYGVPRNTDTITLKRESWTLPASLPLGDSHVIPLNAGEQINWKMV